MHLQYLLQALKRLNDGNNEIPSPENRGGRGASLRTTMKDLVQQLEADLSGSVHAASDRGDR